MIADLDAALSDTFGYSGFRPGQREVIEALLAARSALAILPTGGGKSICYQLPATLLEGLTLVVSPLIALMKDQVDALFSRGIAAARLDSTVTADEARGIYDGMKSGALKLLYVAPERLVNEAFVQRLARTRIALLAIDEAHCISEWGHNFRPEYLRLAKVAKTLGVRRVLTLTATATPDVASDICRAFGIAKDDVCQTSFHRKNLSLHVTPVEAGVRSDKLLKALSVPGRLPAIVYVTLQKTAERVAAFLTDNGLRAEAYHAGLDDETRARVQDDFMSGRVDVIVATIAFGMGIDKADIRSVFHFNLPKTLENYQQEVGRAGRDGKPSHCELFACGDDLTVLKNFIHGDVPEEDALARALEQLLTQGAEFDISRYELSRTTDVRPLVLETVITYLEQENILEPLGAMYTTFQIGFQRPQAEVVAGFSPDRRAFLEKLFASGRSGRKWLTIDVGQSAADLDETRDRILKALHYLEESGAIELKPSGVRHRYRLLPGATDRSPAELARWLAGLFSHRETKDLERLDRVVALALEPGCTTRALLAYFGETMENCGHCGHCLEAPAPTDRLPCRPPRMLTAEDCTLITDLAAERRPALRSPRQLARFLCGITSPATSRDRLGKHPAFGAFEEVPFLDVLTVCEKI
jgi:ATP-dependent DNA helicase RecQ